MPNHHQMSIQCIEIDGHTCRSKSSSLAPQAELSSVEFKGKDYFRLCLGIIVTPSHIFGTRRHPSRFLFRLCDTTLRRGKIINRKVFSWSELSTALTLLLRFGRIVPGHIRRPILVRICRNRTQILEPAQCPPHYRSTPFNFQLPTPCQCG